jgi:outer membrane protein assembly factor BamB
VCPVPYHSAPTVHGTYIAVALTCQSPEQTLLYCLRSDFDYAKAWEFKISTPTGLISSPQWWGSNKIAVTALLCDGEYQGIVADLETRQFTSYTLMKGEPYNPLQILEDRYPVNPVVAGKDLLLISPYGHIVSVNSDQRKSLGQNLKVHFDPVVSERDVIFHITNDKQAWLEWRKIDTLQRTRSTKKYKALWGIATGHVGSSPIVTEQGTICGFGDHLVCFTQEGEVVWEFAYPHIESLDERNPLQVFANEKTVYQTTSEVNISSNLYNHETYVYFVLSDYVSHTSYLAKIDITIGKVIWVSKIVGFSGGFSVVDVLPEGILLQNGVFLWIVAHSGNIIYKKVKLDVDCASCSSLVRVAENEYALLADFGVYEVGINSWELISKTIEAAKDVFLAHASEDKEAVVRPFYKECRLASISAWLDEAEIRWGDSLLEKIEEGLGKARFVVLFISKSFLEKPWPQKELDAALSLNIDGKTVVLPLLLGLSRDEWRKKHPIVASYVYKRVSKYDPAQRVGDDVIKEIVSSLKDLLRHDQSDGTKS